MSTDGALSRSRLLPSLLGIVLLLMGLALLAGGIKLSMLGGSLYYLLAGIGLVLGDFDLAEEALHEAFFVALQRWPVDGVPDNPRAWLVSTGRFKAIDRLRRQSRFTPLLEEQAEALEAAPWSDEDVEDDRLRLMFTCCHPALAADAQVALTMQEICVYHVKDDKVVQEQFFYDAGG